MNKNKKIAIITSCVVAALLLIYTLFGFYGVPYILKNVVPNKLKEMNVSLSLNEVKFNPYTFELNVTKPELNTTSPLFSGEQIDVKLKPFLIFKKLIAVDILRLEKPDIRISRDKNASLNLAPFLSDSNSTSEEKSSLNFALNTAKIVKGSFGYSDENLTHPFNVKFNDINYEISGINTELNSIGKHSFDSNSSLAQKIDWQGGVDISPLRIYGVLKINEFSIKPVAISFIDDQSLQIKNMIIDTKLDYELAADKNATSIKLKDSFLTLKALEAVLENQNMKFSELNIPNIVFDATISDKRDLKLNLDTIALKEPSFEGGVSLNTKELNLSGLALYANIDENSSLSLNTALNSAYISAVSLGQGGLKIANLKDMNASELNASISGGAILADVKNIIVSSLDANIGKNGTASVANITINAPKFTQDTNASFLDIVGVTAQNIGAKAKNKEFASIQDIDVKNINLNLAKTALNIENIDINRPKFTSDLTNKGLSVINDLALVSQSDKNSKQASESGFKFSVKNSSINAADIGINHIFEGQKIAHKFDNLNIKAQNISLEPKSQITAQIDMKSSQKLNLSCDAKVILEPLSVDANVKLADTNLPHFFAYAKSYLDANLKSGALNFEANLKYQKDLSLKGKASVQNIALDDGNRQKVLAFKSIDVAKISLLKNNLNLEQVTLNLPFIKAHLNKQREFNLSKLVIKKDEKEVKPQAKTAKSGDGFDFAVKDFSIKNAEVDFSDASLFMPFATTITKVNGKLSDIDKRHPCAGEFEGIVGKNGFSKITTKLFVYEPKQNTQIKLDFKDIDLTDITPYSGQFAGYKIAKGKLNLNLNYDVKDSKLNGSNFVNFDSLTLGEKVESKDAVNLPLSLAISILSDQNNQINIDLPVEGDLNDPDFKYGGVIWAAVKKLFADITLAPFRFLGAALGINSEKLSTIDFLPNDSELISSESAKILDFIKLTTAKPKMKLSITPSYSDIDELAIKNKRLDNKINLIITQDKKDYMGALASLVPNEKSQDEKVLREAALKNIEFNEQNLIELANQRAQTIKNALKATGLAEDRIVVKEPAKTDAKQNTYVSVPMGVAN